LTPEAGGAVAETFLRNPSHSLGPESDRVLRHDPVGEAETTKYEYRYRARAHPLTLGLAIAIALGVFACDLLTSLHGAVAVLYTTAILVVARTNERRAVLATGVLCAALTLTGWINMHWSEDLDSAALRMVVSLTAIGITTVLSLRNNSARSTLSEQARILELTHDTVIIRNSEDLILYWNEGAEKLYGWSRSEAVGRNSQALLKTEVEGVRRPDLGPSGAWAGEILRTRKNGDRILLASRWLARLDDRGAPNGVIETSADVTEARLAAEERRRSEERYRAIFNAAGFPIWETDLTVVREKGRAGRSPTSRTYDTAAVAERAFVRNANDAAAALFGLNDRSELIGMSTVPFYPPDQAVALHRIWAALESGQRTIEQESQIVAANGRLIDILLQVTLPEGEDAWSRVLVMALDITERNRAQLRLAQSQAELTHVARVTLLGQMAASIAHEVNQPLSAIITYAKSGRRWLKQEAAGATEVEDCLDHIVSNGSRAAEVISRVRAMARKSEPQSDRIDVPNLLDETIALLHRNLNSHQISVVITAPPALPTLFGDRVQIQQVLMNLMLNAEQAMASTPPDDRVICVEVSVGTKFVSIEVKDCGAGIEGDPELLFRPFFTTKSDGMGMGLSICRSIVEKHGGTLMAANEEGRGAVFRFTLPIANEVEGQVS
jgi:PAS domain S-box-containing protein